MERNNKESLTINEKIDFKIPWEFFEKFKLTDKSSLSTGWVKYLKSHFKQINSDCDISFEYNKCLKSVGKKRRKWIAVAHCTKPGCAKYKFSISNNHDVQGSEITVHAERIGIIVNHEPSMSILDEGCSSTGEQLAIICDANNKSGGYLNFEIPYEFWARYKKRETQPRLIKGWTEGFKKYFATVNSACDISIDDNKFRKGRAQKRVWYATAHCTNVKCANYKFSIDGGVVGSSKMKINVKVIGEVKCSRNLVVNDESVTDNEIDTDYFNALTNLRLKYAAKYPGKHIHGYIQVNSLSPFYMTTFSDRSIQYLLNLSLQQKIFCNFSSSATILPPSSGDQRQPRYHALLLRGSESVLFSRLLHLLKTKRF